MASDQMPPEPERREIEAQLALRLEAPVQLVSFSGRPAARLYWFRAGQHESTRLVVKVPLARVGGSSDGDRPRRSPPTPVTRKAMLEFEALQAAERHFDALGDPRFSAVQAVALLEPMQALVMREARGQPFREAVKRAVLRWRPPRTTLEAATLSGAWLRAYHAMPVHDTIEQRLASGAAVAELALELGAFLAAAPYGADAIELAEATAGIAGTLGPADLPLAVVHGDFAMRNVLVGDGRVAVLDMLGRWHAPAYEDVATMTLALDTVGLGGPAAGVLPRPPAIGPLRRAFLEGYFGDAGRIPARPLGVLEALLALERLAALHARRPVGRLLARGLLRTARRSLEASA